MIKFENSLREDLNMTLPTKDGESLLRIATRLAVNAINHLSFEIESVINYNLQKDIIRAYEYYDKSINNAFNVADNLPDIATLVNDIIVDIIMLQDSIDIIIVQGHCVVDFKPIFNAVYRRVNKYYKLYTLRHGNGEIQVTDETLQGLIDESNLYASSTERLSYKRRFNTAKDIVKEGNKNKLDKDIIDNYFNGKMSMQELANKHNTSKTSVFRHAKKIEGQIINLL